MLAAVHARYSSEVQREASIEDQLWVCRQLIGERGWVEGPVFSDMVTGQRRDGHFGLTRRPVLQDQKATDGDSLRQHLAARGGRRQRRTPRMQRGENGLAEGGREGPFRRGSRTPMRQGGVAAACSRCGHDAVAVAQPDGTVQGHPPGMAAEPGHAPRSRRDLPAGEDRADVPGPRGSGPRSLALFLLFDALTRRHGYDL